MSIKKKISQRKVRRSQRVRGGLNIGSLPRVSVFRSSNHIYAQLIDDTKEKTLVSCSSLELNNLKGDKKAVAHAVGLELATRAKNNSIEQAVFDRGSFLYHGRVAALAEGLRSGGLKI